MKLFFCILLLVGGAARASCDNFTSEPLKKFSSNLVRTAAGSSWPGFDFSRTSLIIFDSSLSKRCALAREGKLSRIVEYPVDLPPGGFCGSVSLPCPLGGLDSEHALIWDLGAGQDFIIREIHVPADKVQMQQAIHESFHLFGQTNLLKQAESVPWPSQYGAAPFELRAFIKSRCYAESDSIERIHAKELRKTFAMLRGVLFRKPKSVVKQDLRSFLRIREARLQQLNGIVSEAEGDPLNCETAENRLEIEEGTAEYVGLKTVLNAGIQTPLEAFRYSYEMNHTLIVPGDNGAYYTTGMALMFAIDYLDGGLERFAALLNADTHATLAAKIKALAE